MYFFRLQPFRISILNYIARGGVLLFPVFCSSRTNETFHNYAVLSLGQGRKRKRNNKKSRLPLHYNWTRIFLSYRYIYLYEFPNTIVTIQRMKWNNSELEIWAKCSIKYHEIYSNQILSQFCILYFRLTFSGSITFFFFYDIKNILKRENMLYSTASIYNRHGNREHLTNKRTI